MQSAEAVSQYLSGVGVSECQVQRGVVCILHVVDAERMTCAAGDIVHMRCPLNFCELIRSHARFTVSQ